MNRSTVAALILTAGSFAGVEAGAQEPNALIKDLGSSQYSKRDVATKRLQALYNPQIESELRLTVTSDPEAKRRIETLLAPYYEKQVYVRVEKAREECKGKIPWLQLDDWCQQNYYMGQAKDGKDDGAPEWGKYRRATELLLIDLSKQGYELNPIVEHLKQRHNNWLKNNNSPQEYDQ